MNKKLNRFLTVLQANETNMGDQGVSKTEVLDNTQDVQLGGVTTYVEE